MNAPALTFSDDQAEAWDRVAEALRGTGVDLADGTLTPPSRGQVLGSGGGRQGRVGQDDAAGGALPGADGGRGRGRFGRLRRAPPQGPPHAGDPCADQQGGVACCACAACPRRRSTASSTPRSTTRNTNASPNGWPGNGTAPGGRGADRAGAGPGQGVLRSGRLDPRRAGGGGAARIGLHQGLETARGTAGHRLRRRKLDAGRAPVRRPARDLPDAGAVRRPGAAGPGRASRARWCSTRCGDSPQADAQPHPPAGRRTTRSSISPMRWPTPT